jgi:hypothetical protein
MIATVICTRSLVFLVAEVSAFLIVDATGCHRLNGEDFFRKPLISFAFCHTQLAY